MKTIITDNIECECKNMIAAFLDTDFIVYKILQSYPNLSGAKQKSVSEDIRFYVNQGLELYSVSDTSINTIPLTLFYSLNNFVKAAYLLHFPNLSLAGSHGLDLKTNELEKCKSLGEIPIHFTRKGTFPNLMEVTKDTFNFSDVVMLKDLFSVFPELCGIYSLLYLEEPNVFLLQAKSGNIGIYNVFYETDDEEAISEKNTSLLDQNGYHMYIDKNYLGIRGELSLTTDSWGKEENVIYYDSHGNKYCTVGIEVANKIVKPSKICILYIFYYVFSMLVRYHPHLWMKYCNSKEVSIISKLMTTVKNISLIEVIQLFCDEKYIFTSKISDLEKDFDYSDILKNILKEVEQENRRLGKSILLNYI